MNASQGHLDCADAEGNAFIIGIPQANNYLCIAPVDAAAFIEAYKLR